MKIELHGPIIHYTIKWKWTTKSLDESAGTNRANYTKDLLFVFVIFMDFWVRICLVFIF